MKVRIEFWKLSTGRDGVAAVILDEVVAPAMEIIADTTEEDLPNRGDLGNFCAVVTSLEGDAIVEISETAAGNPLEGRLVREGEEQWFLVKTNSRLAVVGYGAEEV